eukprot:2753426-Karenia_brevis.AAC.1
MGTPEQRLDALERNYNFSMEETTRWRATVDAHMATSGARLSAVESTVRELVQQFERMSHKEKEG